MHKLTSSIHTTIFTIFCFLLISFNAPVMAEESAENTETAQQIEFKALAKEVLSVMDKWARSWAQLEPRGYISSYSPDYVGKGFPSHFTWAANRQQRLQNQKRIQLSLTNVSLSSTKEGHFTITFTQDYKSDTYQDITNKQLDFKLIDGQWYIVAETTLDKK